MENPLSSPVRTGHRLFTWRNLLIFALIVLIGFNLRSIILAVPPVLPLIQRDLGLSYTNAGLLTSLPILVFGGMGWLSGFLIERLGERVCVSLGLLLLGAGALLRALWPATITLFLFTLLLSIGIVLAQTAVPVLARRWFPAHIGLVTALFSDGLIIGEAVAAGLTVPLMGRFLGSDGWIGTFVLWGAPVLVLLALWLWLAPPAGATRRRPPSAAPEETPGASAASATEEERPRVNALHLGILIGGGSLIYYGMNTWIASYNLAQHHADLTPLTLTLLNAAQLPASLLITFFAQRFVGRRSPFVVSGSICLLAVLGWIFLPIALEPLWATLLGASSAIVFTLGIALPPLLARPHEVARLTGITISLTYAVAFLGPFVGGALWDFFHLPPVAFVPVALAALLLIVLGLLLPAHAPHSVQERNDASMEPHGVLPPSRG